MLYKSLNDHNVVSAPSGEANASASSSIVTRPPLCDRHGRTFDYVRIAVIEKCNLRCTYCMPEEGVDFKDKDLVLRADEIQRVVEVLAGMGIKKVRFTGGEPLVRNDIIEIVEAASQTPGIKATHLTTNGLLFPRYAEDLLNAGLTGVNISLDSLQKNKFERITRRSGLDKVLESIDLAIDLGYPRVKVNVVLMRGFNEDELSAFCELTKDKPITVRFIEFMPFDAHQIWETGEHFASAADLVRQIEHLYPGITTAQGTRTEHHIYQAPGYAGKIAVIPAFTRSLCGNCSRIRITADGNLRNCLYSDEEYGLRELLRANCSDDDIDALFRKAFDEKLKDGFEAKKQSSVKKVDVDDIGRVSMTQIGG
ncbi:MAG: GTP 3',8-cyclase MoaA [Gammaproteobacteria bacterium]